MSEQLAYELVKVQFSAEQNAELEKSFRDFYKLDVGPKVKKTLVLEKSEYNKFLKSRMKARTQFEAQKEIDLGFDAAKIPFNWVESITEIGGVMLHEKLNEPGGLTESVQITGTDIKFMSYFQAEGYALAKYLEKN